MAPSAVQAHEAFGEAVVQKLAKHPKLSNGSSNPKHALVLKTFRVLIADLCQQFNGGHPGYVTFNTKQYDYR